MYATRSTGIEIRITWCCGTGCWAFAAGGEGGAVGHGEFSRRSGPEAALGVVFFDDPRLGMPTRLKVPGLAGWLSMIVLCLRSAGVFAEVREDVEELERGFCVYSMGGL